MRFLIFLLFPSIIDSMVIGRRCTEDEESIWKLEIDMCVLAKGFYSTRTDCSINRPSTGGGLIVQGNGFKVVMHDQCTESSDFIVTDAGESHFGTSHTFIKFSNNNAGIPSSRPECSKNISISVYCDQEAGELDFETFDYGRSHDLSVELKYDRSCIDYLGLRYIYSDDCYRRGIQYDERYAQACGARDVYTRDKYLRTCTNKEFDRSVYRKYMEKSKKLHAKTEL
ncbi:6 kDa intracellular viral protein [Borealpox virus]|nr:6 kDa intracellular viral protein [Alaskapox virus]